jgi:hypothetical protein
MLTEALGDARRFDEAATTAALAVRVARERGKAPLAAELERAAAAYRSRAQGR